MAKLRCLWCDNNNRKLYSQRSWGHITIMEFLLPFNSESYLLSPNAKIKTYKTINLPALNMKLSFSYEGKTQTGGILEKWAKESILEGTDQRKLHKNSSAN